MRGFILFQKFVYWGPLIHSHTSSFKLQMIRWSLYRSFCARSPLMRALLLCWTVSFRILFYFCKALLSLSKPLCNMTGSQDIILKCYKRYPLVFILSLQLQSSSKEAGEFKCRSNKCHFEISECTFGKKPKRGCFK